MLRFALPALVLCALFITGCTSTKVVTDYNPRANFSTYQRFAWADNSGGDKMVSPLAIDQVHSSLQDQLKTGLYTPAPSPDKADFVVRYYVAEAPETIDRSPRLGIGLGSFTGNIGIGTSVGVPLGKDTVVRNIQILIDLQDPASHKLTWRGSLVVELSGSDPRANQAAIADAVAKIWAEFPPKR